MRRYHLRALAAVFSWASLTVSLAWGQAADVPREAFGRTPTRPLSLDLLTPPERTAGALPQFDSLLRKERALPLTTERARSWRFDSQLAPLTPPGPLLKWLPAQGSPTPGEPPRNEGQPTQRRL